MGRLTVLGRQMQERGYSTEGSAEQVPTMAKDAQWSEPTLGSQAYRDFEDLTDAEGGAP